MSHPIHTAEVLTAPPTVADGFLPEGPRCVEWNGKSMLGWVNIQTTPDATAGAIWLRDWDTGQTQSRILPGRPGFFLPTTIPNVVLVGMSKQIGLFNLKLKAWTPLNTISDGSPWTIINDGEATPDGRFVVFGTKDVRFKEPIGHLYLFNAENNTLRELASGQTCSNGKILHSAGDGYTLYDIDTPTRCVRRYHLDVSPPRLRLDGTMLDLASAIGFPDGMTDTGDGSALIAFYNPAPAEFGLAVAYDLVTGSTVGEWRLPGAPRVTCPLLTSRHGKSQVIFTTALEGMPDDMRRIAASSGAVFISDTNFDSIPKSVLVKMMG